jgi:2-polyprenyl-3-methyl-5-hydroxy-6-metoxy-1,4-benzoquinol methylase
VIGRKELPAKFAEWNEKWGAPFGYQGNRDFREGREPDGSLRLASRAPASPEVGPFGFQPNSSTRIYEYPWAFFTAELEPGMRTLDIGGGISGFQFVLAKQGCAVTNVDPTARADYNLWSDPGFVSLNAEQHAMVNRVMGTDVQLIPERIQDADLEPGSFDRVFCLSVLEHVEPDEAHQMLASVADALRPGGRALVTVDLFLDLRPFGVLTRNRWGINMNVGALIEGSGLRFVYGDPRELLGTPEFDFDRVVALLPELLIGASYPVMTQTLVLEKASLPGHGRPSSGPCRRSADRGRTHLA